MILSRQRYLQLGMTVFYLLIVIVAWGTNYPLMKLALQDIPPLTFAAVRLFGGAVFIAILIRLSGAPRLLPPREDRRGLSSISMLQFASVLGFAGVALLFLPAGRTVTVIYSMPLWAAIFEAVIMRSRLSKAQYAGILASLTGMLLFLDPSVIEWGDPGTALGVLLSLSAGICWGLGTVLYRARRWQASLLSQTLWQLIAAGVVLTAAALLIEYPATVRLTQSLVLITLWNFVVPTGIAVWAWTKILSYISGAIAGQFLMVTPFVGIATSAWIFNEDLPPAFAMSAALISLGGCLTLLRGPAPTRKAPAS